MRPTTAIDADPDHLGALDPFDTPAGGLAHRVAWRARDHHPVTVAALISIVGVLIMGALIVGIGLLLTHVLLAGGLGRWDEGVNDWFVTHRTSSMNAVTAVGSTIGSTGTVVAIAVVAVAVLAIRRLWQEVGLIVIALTVEVVVFLTTTLIVNRPRPTVPRLDVSPPTSSFPSGHTAAAIALWFALAIVISVHVRNALVRALVWAIAFGVPVFIAISRLYRGMHHPTDVIASALLGAGALLTALIAVRTASAVADSRQVETERRTLDAPSGLEVTS
jgi:membrane-associated phospholipid phosphatase